MRQMSKKALLTGSFDPPTVGHLDLITKAAGAFDEVVVCIFCTAQKAYMFTEEERLTMLRAMINEAELENVTADVNGGYVADYAKERDITCVVRGVRGMLDLEYEVEMAHYNKKRNPDLETFFWVAPESQEGISSTEARKVIRMGMDPDVFCTKAVVELIRKYRQ